ncbi:MAG: methylmalonyl-CoA epimerase [Firmicutes bacterium]|nr:methylmalonyl-CoA epimerase [Bacillota bacterium]
MILGINHIGIAVKSIDGALSAFNKIFNTVDVHSEELPDRKIKIASMRINESSIEFIESAGIDSAIAKFIEKRGEGIHHIAFTVKGIDGILKQLKDNGVPLVDEVSRPGAHGTKVAFLHPSGTNGVLIELCEP